MAVNRLTRIVAHRSGAGLWPENSHCALDGVRSHAVDAVELDVHLTSDDEVVVLHDATLDRTTLGKGPVRHRSSQELAGIQVRDCGEGVPLLRDVLARHHDAGYRISLEMKTGIGGQRYPLFAERVVRTLDETGWRGRAFVHSFDWRLLKDLHAIAPDIPVGGNVDDGRISAHGGIEDTIASLLEHGIHHINLDYRLADDHVIALAQNAGLEVTLWTVNDPDRMLEFMRAGADWLTTDHPDIALELRQRLLAGVSPASAPAA